MTRGAEGIRYRRGYKYQLAEDYGMLTTVRYVAEIDTQWIALLPNGDIWIRAGYAWDGPSGPTIDTKTFLRGSLVHDALYQLIRAGRLPRHFRDAADRELVRICKADGMSAWRRWYVYHALRIAGAGGARPSGEHPIEAAP